MYVDTDIVYRILSGNCNDLICVLTFTRSLFRLRVCLHKIEKCEMFLLLLPPPRCSSHIVHIHGPIFLLALTFTCLTMEMHAPMRGINKIYVWNINIFRIFMANTWLSSDLLSVWKFSVIKSHMHTLLSLFKGYFTSLIILLDNALVALCSCLSQWTQSGYWCNVIAPGSERARTITTCIKHVSVLDKGSINECKISKNLIKVCIIASKF